MRSQSGETYKQISTGISVVIFLVSMYVNDVPEKVESYMRMFMDDARLLRDER